MEKFKNIALGLLASTLLVPCAHATEGGQNASPVGVNTVLPGILPAPGHAVFLDYSQFYDTRSKENGSGNNIANNFNAELLVNALRFLYTWKPGIDNFHVTSGFVFPVVLRASAKVGSQKGTNGGLSDITLQPLAFDYVTPNHHLFAWLGIDIFVPTGQYSSHQMVNIGRNYYTFAPDLNATWLVNKRLQISLHGQWEFHTTNNVTNYHSGDIGFLTYAVDYTPFPQLNQLHFGIQGYTLKQFTNDTENGVVYKNGYKGQAFAIGPQIRWSWNGGGIALKWQHEFLVRNRTKGDRIWVQFALPVA